MKEETMAQTIETRTAEFDENGAIRKLPVLIRTDAVESFCEAEIMFSGKTGKLKHTVVWAHFRSGRSFSLDEDFASISEKLYGVPHGKIPS